MKLSSIRPDRADKARRLFGATTGLRLMVAVAAATSMFGCGKKSEAPDPGATQADQGTGQSRTQMQSAAPQPVANPAIQEAAPAPDLAQLTRDLRRWILRNQRPPKDFEDFAATANVPIPPAPPGKKYVIDKQMHVILVNR